MPHSGPSSFLPPFVRELVCYTPTTANSVQPELTTPLLTPSGVLSLGVFRTYLPTLSDNPAAPPTLEHLKRFKAMCVVIQSELNQLALSRPLHEVYSDAVLSMDPIGVRSTKTWFQLHTQGLYDQAWLLGSTVVEQLLVNVRFVLLSVIERYFRVVR